VKPRRSLIEAHLLLVGFSNTYAGTEHTYREKRIQFKMYEQEKVSKYIGMKNINLSVSEHRKCQHRGFQYES
jgi:hypothetical protein